MPAAASFDFTTLSVVEVSRHFGRRKALNKVSFISKAGDIIGLLGPNGAGKSTLLSILATLSSPTLGSVRYGERTARDAGPEIRARLGALGHDLYLYPELTARENLVFFGRLYGVGDVGSGLKSDGGSGLKSDGHRPRHFSDLTPRVDAALARAGLTDRADDVVAGFSRGMRQKLAIERALLHEPRLLLLDEPFTGLDDTATQSLVARLVSLKGDGTIVLLTTHDLDVVDGMLDQVLVLQNGRLVTDERQPAPGLRERFRRVLAGGAR